MLNPCRANNLNPLKNIEHGFFTREGGVSEGIYTTLNCGRGSNDDPAAVSENRRRVAYKLGAHHSDIVTPYQIHSADVITVCDPLSYDNLPKADGIVTATPGLAIGVLTADCAPVLFADPVAGIVAAAHAGWRGAVAGVLQQTIERMMKAGAQKSNIHAAVGPCINQNAYEVGHEFEAELTSQNIENKKYFAIPPRRTKPHFDLPAFVLDQLHAQNIASVDSIKHCTRENESLFFSYRGAQAAELPDYGRQISAILVT